MNKYLKFLLFSLAALFLFSAGVYAQTDSTAVAAASPSFLSTVISSIEGKYAWVTGVLAVIVALDHLLAALPSVKANSTYQLISNAITSLVGR